MKWKCPKCNREFDKKNQGHYCLKPQNIDEYIALYDDDVKAKLNEIRLIIKSAIPMADEIISWSMPTYHKGRNIIHFAASKKHIGLYPGEEAILQFKEELGDYDVSKGTIRLPYDKKLPKALITKIARWCYKKYSK